MSEMTLTLIMYDSQTFTQVRTSHKICFKVACRSSCLFICSFSYFYIFPFLPASSIRSVFHCPGRIFPFSSHLSGSHGSGSRWKASLWFFEYVNVFMGVCVGLQCWEDLLLLHWHCVVLGIGADVTGKLLLVGRTVSVWVQGKTAMWRRYLRKRETDRKPRNRIVLWISAMETPYDDTEGERQEKRGTGDSFSGTWEWATRCVTLTVNTAFVSSHHMGFRWCWLLTGFKWC